MAEARIDRYDAEDGRLPRVCMKCGAPSDHFVFKQMNWHPPWVIALVLVGLLPFLIVAFILTKRIRLRAPMCFEHQNHWFSRSLAVGLSFGGLFMIGLIAFFLMVNIADRNPRNPLPGLFCIGSLVLLGAWLIVTIILHLTSIRPKEITEWDVTLVNVSPRFVDELDGIYREEYERRRRRRRRRPEYDDDEDDRPPPPRRPPSLPDSIEEM